MTFNEYLDKVYEYHRTFLKTSDPQRFGQACFNVLATVRPDLSEALRGDATLDPFYVDYKLPEFFAYVEERW